MTCAVLIFAFTFLPTYVLDEPGWILLIGCTLIPFTIIEWIGRGKVGEKSNNDEKEQDTHTIPLLEGEFSDTIESKISKN